MIEHSRIAAEIAAAHDAGEWGDPNGFTVEDWFALIEHQTDWFASRLASMPGAAAEGRARLIQIAALAVAGVESLDRAGRGSDAGAGRAAMTTPPTKITPLPTATMLTDRSGNSMQFKSGAIVTKNSAGAEVWFFPTIGDLLRIQRTCRTIMEKIT